MAEQWNANKITRDKPYWIGFNIFRGIGPEIFRRLLRYFGSAEAAWGASATELAGLCGIKLAKKLSAFRASFVPEQAYANLTAAGITVAILPEAGYPPLLREIEAAPPVLFCLGESAVLGKPQIAVVGTRRMTAYGAKVTVQLVKDLVDAGLVIVSGLAYGIDTLAHKTALKAGGETVAVLGNGVDICYPAEHRQVYAQIIGQKHAPAQGVVVAEIPPGVRTQRGIFVARNRIISGLSLGVVVVEGAKKSGTLITAGYAAAQGREVFAVPGPITSRFSEGPNLLIKEGAKPVTAATDILAELKLSRLRFDLTATKNNSTRQKKARAQLSADERNILTALEQALRQTDRESAHIDTIIRQAALESGKVGSILSVLEVKGIIKEYAGGKYGLS